ncbi:hypothetical protein AB1Y20_020411 [Prymnesium parvum]|uniref:NYN domain-containing protein n=1 Tax=Prymnesium parvum TaxID=97485 RepID=A0AB34JXX3_PRYPA
MLDSPRAPSPLPQHLTESEGHAAADEAEEFDRFFSRAVRIGVVSEAEVDELTDQLALGVSSPAALVASYAPLVAAAAAEAAPSLDPNVWSIDGAYEEEEAWGAAEEAWAEHESEEGEWGGEEGAAVREGGGGTIGIILDVHYLQVAASSFSLATTWSVPDFEAALVRASGGGAVRLRIACDSCRTDAATDEAYGKARLHSALASAGYRLVLSPNKSVRQTQGATDVDIACAIFEAAGAFAAAPAASTLLLVAGDADFQPALAAALAARPAALRVLVAADAPRLSRAYAAWLGARLLPLSAVLRRLAPRVIDLREDRRPAAPSGRADAAAVAAAVARAARRAEAEAGGAAEGSLTLHLSGRGGPAWADGEVGALLRALRALPAACAALGGVWMHHTAVGDGGCAQLGELLRLAPRLRELHLSDSAVSLVGVRAIGEAARAAREGGGGEGRRLYVNVRHLGGEEALALAAEYADCLSVRLVSGRELRREHGGSPAATGGSPGGKGGSSGRKGAVRAGKGGSPAGKGGGSGGRGGGGSGRGSPVGEKGKGSPRATGKGSSRGRGRGR